MNREIKYRAWHKKEKRMIAPVIQLHLDHEPFIGWYETMHDALEGNLTTAFLDEVELREYTGLKDKNGREVYEGDILESNHKLFRFEVIWSEDWAMFTVKGDSVEALIRWATYCEVIGNIYENPELLKGAEA